MLHRPAAIVETFFKKKIGKYFDVNNKFSKFEPESLKVSVFLVGKSAKMSINNGKLMVLGQKCN